MRRILISLFLIVVSVLVVYGGIQPKGKKMVELKVANDPTVSVKVWFKVGSQDDPKGKEGLSYITAQMLNEGGTIAKSYDKILEELYPLAAGYSANAGTEMTMYTGRVHKDNLELYSKLFIEQLLSPGFREEDLNRIKENALNYLQKSLKYSNDEELGKQILYQDIFAGTGYENSVVGTISGIQSITINDVKNFFATYYNKNNYVLAIGGGYTEEYRDYLIKELSKLPEGKENLTSAPEPKPISGLNVTIVEKDANATAISMGFPIDVVRGSKEWYALAIANSWLGEHRNSSSHLYQVIREERGLNYGDYSYIEHFPNGGRMQMPPTNVARKKHIFEIWIRPVPNETRHFVLRAAMREFQSLVEAGMNEQDFATTKQFLKKYILHFAPNTETRLGFAIDDLFYGIEEGHLTRYARMLDEITLEDVNAAIKKHFQFKNMQIAVITPDAESFKKAIVSNVESPIVYSTPKSVDVLAEDKNIINFPLNISDAKVRILTLEELFK